MLVRVLEKGELSHMVGLSINVITMENMIEIVLYKTRNGDVV